MSKADLTGGKKNLAGLTGRSKAAPGPRNLAGLTGKQPTPAPDPSSAPNTPATSRPTPPQS